MRVDLRMLLRCASIEMGDLRKGLTKIDENGGGLWYFKVLVHQEWHVAKPIQLKELWGSGAIASEVDVNEVVLYFPDP